MLVVNQFQSGLGIGDAITNEMLTIRESLLAAGYRSEIYGRYIPSELEGLVKPISQYEGQDNSILLVHHSMGILAEDFTQVTQLRDKKILLYHNITPSEFLADDPYLHEMSMVGRRQLALFRRHVNFAFGDSEFNRLELVENGFKYTGVLPIIIDFKRYNVEPDQRLLGELKDHTNIFFVGRLAPNKRQEDLIKVFYYYHNYINRKSNLLLLYQSDLHYESYLKDLAKSLRLSNYVRFIRSGSVKDLVTCYRAADIFLSMSEHEGFCVPLVESMHFQVPIVAYNSAAVPHTLGSAGVLVSEKNFEEVAALIDAILSDNHLRRKIIDRQNMRLEQFKPEKTFSTLQEVVERTAAGDYPLFQREICIEGPCETSYSLAMINRSIGLALNKLAKYNVSLHITEGPGDYPVQLEKFDDKPEVKDLWLKSKRRDTYDITIRNMYPPRVHDAKGRIRLLYFTWEDSLIHPDWATNFNRYLDGIMVPSSFVRDVLARSGVTVPISVIPYGVSLDAPLGKKTMQPSLSKKRFKFLNISSGFPRKGIDILLDAYCEEFSAKDDVCLVLLTFPNIHNQVASMVKEKRRKPESPEILHIDRDIGRADVIALYENSDCVAYPTRAEGFAFVVAEAMLARKPVIATSYGGHMDFCSENNSFLMPFKLVPSTSHLNVPGALWAEPNKNELRKLMRFVYENYGSAEVALKVEKAFEAIKNYTWDAAAQRVDDFIRNLSQDEAHKLRVKVAMVTPWTPNDGIAQYSRNLMSAVAHSDELVDFTVFASTTVQGSEWDDYRVKRCWDPYQNPTALLNALKQDESQVVHIQCNFGLFQLPHLAQMIDGLKKAGKKLIVTFHSTAPVLHRKVLRNLQGFADELRKVDLILVHTEKDRSRLASYGISSNVKVFPHGFPNPTPSILTADPRVRQLVYGKPIIATNGYFLPHKGVLETIKAVRVLLDSYPSISYVIVCSLHHDPSSLDYYRQCLAEVKELGLERNITFVTDIFQTEGILQLLGLSDLIVMPYKDSQESSSAAVRLALASGHPVVVTDRDIFSEFSSDEVFKIKDCTPPAIAEAVIAVYESQKLKNKLIEAARDRVLRHSWKNLGGEYSKLLLRIVGSETASRTQIPLTQLCYDSRVLTPTWSGSLHAAESINRRSWTTLHCDVFTASIVMKSVYKTEPAT